MAAGPASRVLSLGETQKSALTRACVGEPDSMKPGDAANVKLLSYFPEYPYEEVQPGVTFTVGEWPLIVRCIQSRGMESFPLLAGTSSMSVIACFRQSRSATLRHVAVVLGFNREVVFPALPLLHGYTAAQHRPEGFDFLESVFRCGRKIVRTGR